MNEYIRSPHLDASRAARLHQSIEVVPDFPRTGIMFRNVLPALRNPEVMNDIVMALCAPYAIFCPDLIVGIESRGFIFAAAMAERLGAGFVPVRKAGKLPGNTLKASYDLEYGSATVELQAGAIQKGAKVVIVDDLLATGGTATAAASLVQQVGGEVLSFDFVIELRTLHGRSRLPASHVGVHSLLSY